MTKPARGVLLLVSGVCLGGLAWLVTVRMPLLLPDDARTWGGLALGALGAGMVLLGAQALLGRSRSS